MYRSQLRPAPGPTPGAPTRSRCIDSRRVSRGRPRTRSGPGAPRGAPAGATERVRRDYTKRPFFDRFWHNWWRRRPLGGRRVTSAEFRSVGAPRRPGAARTRASRGRSLASLALPTAPRSPPTPRVSRARRRRTRSPFSAATEAPPRASPPPPAAARRSPAARRAPRAAPTPWAAGPRRPARTRRRRRTAACDATASRRTPRTDPPWRGTSPCPSPPHPFGRGARPALDDAAEFPEDDRAGRRVAAPPCSSHNWTGSPACKGLARRASASR